MIRDIASGALILLSVVLWAAGSPADAILPLAFLIAANSTWSR